jgi:signal transduction histidine kinase
VKLDSSPAGVETQSASSTDPDLLEGDREQLLALGRFAAGVAHDLQVLLRPIGAVAQRIGGRLPEDADAQLGIDRIVQAAELGRDLAAQILAYSRGGQPERAPVSLGSVVRRALPLLRATLPRPTALRASVDRDTPLMHGNAVALQRVLLNLVLNAAQSLAARGSVIEVGVVAVEADDTAEPGERHARVRLTVADDGAGMDPPQLHAVLESLGEVNLAAGGKASGLAIVNAIVRAHCGRLSITTQAGRGTSVRVDFPAVLPDRAGRIARTHVCNAACLTRGVPA